MAYRYTELTEEISIRKIISIHYFEYMSDFSFPGESHNFWELLCVDKGEVEVTSDHETMVLKRGDIIFHKPNEFHGVTANGVVAPNLVVIGFECGDPGMSFFEDKVLTISERERNLLAQIIAEARNGFASVLNDPYLEQLVRKEQAPFGTEQMIKIHLEQLLIQLYRNFSLYHQIQIQKHDILENDKLYNSIIAYMESNLRNQISIEKICRDNLIGSSQLKKLFRDRNSCGVIEYFTTMKTDLAKQLIRGRQLNITQIADYLGYSSIHYFSRQFKKETGMTPTEYANSIKQRSERPFGAHF